MAGRPKKLTRESQQSMLSAIRNGAYIETATAHAGIERTTHYLWMRKGAYEARRRENAEKPRKLYADYLDYYDQVQKALADAELNDLAVITQSAIDGTWQAAAWKLERRYPDKYGRRTHTTLAGDEDSPLVIDDARDTLEQRLRKYEQ